MGIAQLRANPSVNGNIGNWKQRHNEAIEQSSRTTHVPFESPMVRMMTAWQVYALNHESRYESKIGDDSVLGKEWLEIGEAMLGLLNGELGYLDGGTCDAFIRDTICENGFTADDIK
jgi:hypothetical protein